MYHPKQLQFPRDRPANASGPPVYGMTHTPGEQQEFAALAKDGRANFLLLHTRDSGSHASVGEGVYKLQRFENSDHFHFHLNLLFMFV